MPGARRDRLEHLQRLAFVLGAPVVERDGERLALDVVPVDRRRERVQPLAPVGGLRHELEAVLADVDELVEPDDAPRIRAGAAADAGDERVALVQPRDLGARLLRHDGLVRNLDDRREHAVDVEQDRRARRVLGEPREQGAVAVHAPRIRAVPLKLVAIGLVAGLFSALFGVGGGIVIVPLLILLLAFDGKVATGDLAGGDRDHRARRHDPLRLRGPRRRRATPPLVGLPAAAGAIAGTAIQQRISARALVARLRGPAHRRSRVWLLVG